MASQTSVVRSHGDWNAGHRVGQFRFDPQSGQLTPNDPAWVAEGGAPRHMAFHRSGRFAYLLTENSNNVVAYTYDGTTGRLAPLGRAVAATSGASPMAQKLRGLGLSAQQIEGVLALSREVIEQVVWEVVPDLAEVLIKDDDESTLHVSLRQEPLHPGLRASDGISPWWWVAGGVLAAGAGVGTYFLLRPGDEPARPELGTWGGFQL